MRGGAAGAAQGSFWPGGRLLDLAGETALIIRRLIVTLTVAVVTVVCAGQALAQSAVPAPLPGQTVQKNDPALPPVNGSAPAASLRTPSSSFPVNGAAPISGSAFERGPAPPQGG